MKTLKALILSIACVVLIPLMPSEASAAVDLPQDAPTFNSHITSDDMYFDGHDYWAKFSPPFPGSYTLTMGVFSNETNGGFSVYDNFGESVGSTENTHGNKALVELPYIELTVDCNYDDCYIRSFISNSQDFLITVEPTATAEDYTDILQLWQFKHIPADSEQQEFIFTPLEEGFYRFQLIGKTNGGIYANTSLRYRDTSANVIDFSDIYLSLFESEYTVQEHIAYLDADCPTCFGVQIAEPYDKTIVVSKINSERVYETIPNDFNPSMYTFDWTVIFKYTAPADGIYYGDNPTDSASYHYRAIDCETRDNVNVANFTIDNLFCLETGHTYYIKCTDDRKQNDLEAPPAVSELEVPLLRTSLSKSEMSNMVDSARYVKFCSDISGSYTITLGTFTNSEMAHFLLLPDENYEGFDCDGNLQSNIDRYESSAFAYMPEAKGTINYAGGDLYIQVVAHDDNTPWCEVDDYAISIEYNGKSIAKAAPHYVYNGRLHVFSGSTYGYKWIRGDSIEQHVGEYTAVVELYPGYEWEDGTTEPKTLKWSITPAPATVKAPNKTIYVGDAVPELDPSLCTITGLFGDDEIGTIELSYASEPDTSAAGTVAINAAITDPNANYEITVQAGTLTISNRPSPSMPSGGGGGGTSKPDPEESVVENPDGSTTTTVTDPGTETVTETTIYKNGDTLVVETQKDGTVTKTETKTDGSKSETITKPDGSSVSKVATADGVQSESKKMPDGEVTATVTLPDTPSKPIFLPIEPAPVGKSIVSIEAKSEVRVIIPAARVTPGTVAVIVHEDGTEEIVRRSVPTESGIALKINSSVTIKLVDNALEFDDVATDAWYSNSVDFVSSRGIMNGVAERLFAPDDNMTRAMFTTTLARFDGQDTTDGETWYTKGQEWAVENAVSDGTNPDAFITREEIVTMLYRYAKSQITIEVAETENIAKFDDSAAVSSWAKESMGWAIHNQIINGKTVSSLDPQGLATRAEVSTILMRFCKLLAE